MTRWATRFCFNVCDISLEFELCLGVKFNYFPPQILIGTVLFHFLEVLQFNAHEVAQFEMVVSAWCLRTEAELFPSPDQDEPGGRQVGLHRRRRLPDPRPLQPQL